MSSGRRYNPFVRGVRPKATCKYRIVRFLLVPTWVNNGVLLVEGDSTVPTFPLGPLDFQIALFNRQQGDALVMCSVELSQVLEKTSTFVSRR